ncbi:MAG: hypothetical protein K2P09_05025 [Erysipelotrichales bacterium]|nr:hypothetical protein [Erysipelotrichales bacterium]
MKKKTLIGLIVVLVIAVVAFEFSRNREIKFGFFKDFIVVKDIQEAKENSKMIVKGNFESFDKEWNMHRDDNDLSKENPYGQTLGKIYNFKINEFINGDLDTTNIKINMEYSTRIFYNDSGILHGEEIVNSDNVNYVDIASPKYMEPDFNKEYILYLNYDEFFDLYYSAFQPYMIEVNNNKLNLLIGDLAQDTITLEKKDNYGRKVIVEQQHHTVEDFIKDMDINEFRELNK